MALPSHLTRSQTARDMKVRTFEDHRGVSACTVFDTFGKGPLPPLITFTVYFVHKDTNQTTVEPIKLLETIAPDGLFLDSRLELHFLSGANVEGCIGHYRNEQTKRGDYQRQVDIVKTTATKSELPDESSAMPGLAPKMFERTDRFLYHNVLYVIKEQDWKSAPLDAKATQVDFDRISQEEHKSHWSAGDMKPLTDRREEEVWLCAAGPDGKRPAPKDCLFESMERMYKQIVDHDMTKAIQPYAIFLKARDRWGLEGWPVIAGGP